MPVYEYQCSKCGKTFELRRKFSDPPVTVHEECGGTVEQLLSAPAFQLKGTGWYATDYAKSGKKDEKKDGDSKESGESKGDSKAEGKSESKGDPGPGGDSKSGDSSTSSKESTSSSKSESKPAATKSDG